MLSAFGKKDNSYIHSNRYLIKRQKMILFVDKTRSINIKLCALIFCPNCMLIAAVSLFQTEEEREWFAEAFETKNQLDLSNDRRIDLANLMLKSQVTRCSHVF